MKPYISKLGNIWEVLDSKGKVKYSSKNYQLANTYFIINFDKLR